MESRGDIASGYFRLPTCRTTMPFTDLRQRFESDLGQIQHIRECRRWGAPRFALHRKTRSTTGTLSNRWMPAT